jgi:hypothetical protein
MSRTYDEFICTTCDQVFKSIPDDAVLLKSNRGGRLYRWPNGDVHNLKGIKTMPSTDKE